MTPEETTTKLDPFIIKDKNYCHCKAAGGVCHLDPMPIHQLMVLAATTATRARECKNHKVTYFWLLLLVTSHKKDIINWDGTLCMICLINIPIK